ncbi:MAG: hypothetical protein DRQ88_09855 [Epsilonproteobacteria bacterium]|nr:MAG: hypothetical protein DRQ89_02545 [Campylobacterota bacterium]RLA65143.1 MAG: hypothetical protein DRQ88_09855 [Campylobacterota bacterium]
MHLKSRETINRPLDEVYKLVRDDLEKLVPYLPNVEKIEVKNKKKEKDNSLKITNYWYAKAEIPLLVKKFIKPEFLSWKDKAVWKDGTYTVEYELESFFANDLFEAKGVNSFTAKGENKTEFILNCEVKIYPEKVPGVPRFLAKKISPVINALVEKILGPNLTAMGKGINQYFKDN